MTTSYTHLRHTHTSLQTQQTVQTFRCGEKKQPLVQLLDVVRLTQTNEHCVPLAWPLVRPEDAQRERRAETERCLSERVEVGVS